MVHDLRESHTGDDFLAFMKKVARSFPDQELHVIIDNSSTHTTPAVMEWLRQNPRITFHFTPTSASWMNQVEGFFSILTRRSLKHTSFPSKGLCPRHAIQYTARSANVSFIVVARL